MQTRILATVVACVVALVLLHFLVGFQTVGGNQLGVKETWWGGVDPQPLAPRTYMFIPGFTTKVYPYDKSTQVFIMNNMPSHIEKVGKGRETDAYKVQSEEGQDMTISLSVQWRIDPDKVVEIHKTVRHDIEEKILRPTVMRVVKDAATTRKAIDAYSGPGVVKLQKEIQDHLTDPKSDLRSRGVIVENFVIEAITLDPDYIGQIKARQVATQKQLTAAEEQKAAEAVALRSKSEAQADYNKRVVEAERDKAVGVLKAEQEAKQQVLAATAAKQQQVLAAEGEQEASVLKAKAVLALGEAEAEATRLKLSAYSAQGADAFVKIEVSKNIGYAFSGIKGFLPADMKFNVLTESMQRSVNLLMGTDGSGDTSPAVTLAPGASNPRLSNPTPAPATSRR